MGVEKPIVKVAGVCFCYIVKSVHESCNEFLCWNQTCFLAAGSTPGNLTRLTIWYVDQNKHYVKNVSRISAFSQSYALFMYTLCRYCARRTIKYNSEYIFWEQSFYIFDLKGLCHEILKMSLGSLMINVQFLFDHRWFIYFHIAWLVFRLKTKF